MPPRRNSCRRTDADPMTLAKAMYKSIVGSAGNAWTKPNSTEPFMDKLEDLADLLTTIKQDVNQSIENQRMADMMHAFVLKLLYITEEHQQDLFLVTFLI